MYFNLYWPASWIIFLEYTTWIQTPISCKKIGIMTNNAHKCFVYKIPLSSRNVVHHLYLYPQGEKLVFYYLLMAIFKSDWNHRYPFNINIVHFYNIYIYLHMIFISSRTKLHLSYLVTKIWLYYSTILTDQAQNLVRHVQFITLQTAEFKQIPTNKRIKCEAISMNKLMTIFDHNYSYLWSNIVVNLFRFIASRCIWWTRSLQIKNARIRW